MVPIPIQIPVELFTPAEIKHYEEDAVLDRLEVGPDVYKFEGPLHWKADITNTGGALLVAGTVSGGAECDCARCLGPVKVPFQGEIEGYFLIGAEDAAPEDMEDDEFDYLPEDKTINMAPLIQQAIMLEMPLVPLCSEDCRGLCPKCGADLNEGDCECIAASNASDGGALDDADAIRPDNPFSVLKDFDFG